jgi:putative oxidoreductase
MIGSFMRGVVNPVILRAALAAVFIFHGYQLVTKDGDWGASWMTKAASASGQEAPPPALQMAVAWGQLIGGGALALGFLTRLAALGIIAIMAGAIALVHLPNGFDNQHGGYEYNIVLIAAALCLVLGGPGPVAFDYFFSFRRTPPPPKA